MNKNFKFITMALSFVLCFTAIAFGQKTTGNIEGTITDPNGAVVPGATVSLSSTGSTVGTNASTTTNSDGYFIFAQIPAGTYTLSVTGSGFKTTKKEVSVSIDKTTNLDAKLETGIGETIVDVQSDSTVQLDMSDTKIDNNINKRVIEDLPSGTTFTSLLKIAPNVRPEALAAGFQIDGASGSENVFNIDGQEVTNFRTGQLNTANNLSFDLVQEVQIKSTGYEAENGGATGGIIQVVTPGGNDSWRGNFGISFSPTKFTGSPRSVLNRFSTNAAGNYEYFNPPKQGGTDFFPVANFSGPIAKGKLWFSASFAPQIFERNITIDYFGNSTPGNSANNPNGRTIAQSINYKSKQTTNQMLARIDGAPSSKFRFFATFLYNPVVVEGALPSQTEGLGGVPQTANFGGSIGTLTGADFLRQQGGRQNSNSVNGQITWNPVNFAVINVRAGRTFLNEKLGSYGLPRSVRYLCSANGNPAAIAGSGCSQGFTNFANNFQIDYDVSTRRTLDADAAFVGINAGGRHNMKFGYQFNGLFNTTKQGYADTGVVVLVYNTSIASGTGQMPTGSHYEYPSTDPRFNPTGLCSASNYIPGEPCNTGYGYLQRFGTIGEAASNNHGLFAQDSWQVMRRLTVNLGVRIESETVPNFGAAGTQAIKFGWGDKISPRLGAAFDVTGDGKNKIFASYGWFYDRFKYELPRGSFGGDFYRRDYFEILPTRGNLWSNYTRGAILGTVPDILGGNCPSDSATPLGNGWSTCQFDFRIATNIAGANIFESGAVDPNIKAARQSEYTIGFERQMGNNHLFAARYTHKQIDRAIEDIGVFNSQGSEAYIIGNPGLGLACEISTGANLPCAKAQRDYDAVEVRVDKRASNYFYNASYTWSRLFGNYSGLASSDEAGRASPNVNRFFDLPMLGFNADGDPDNGLLATDRTHVFKAYGGYSHDWAKNGINRTTISAFTSIQSGTPLTTNYTLYAVTTAILNERGDLGRTEMFTETDLSVSHRYKFGRDARFTLEAFMDIRNLFDEKNVLTADTTISTADLRASQLTANGCTTCATEGAVFNTIFNGPGIRTFVNNYLANPNTALGSRLRNTYGLANGFQGPRDVRFGFRFFF